MEALMMTTTVRDVSDVRFLVPWRRSVAIALIAALLLSGLPASALAAWRDRSSELPGTVSNTTVITIAAVGAAAVVATIILVKKKGGKEVVFEVESPTFAKPNGGPVTGKAKITNMMGDPITIKQLVLEGEATCFSLPEGRQVPFTVAPGEQVDVTVNYDPASGRSTKGHLRIVASAPNVKKDTSKVISFSAPKEEPDAIAYEQIPEGIILPPRPAAAFEGR
jgi:hypothetical protein